MGCIGGAPAVSEEYHFVPFTEGSCNKMDDLDDPVRILLRESDLDPRAFLEYLDYRFFRGFSDEI